MPKSRGAHLSRSQVRVLADALAPVAAGKTREAAARALGVKEYVVQKVLQRPAALDLPHEALRTLATELSVDVAGWDVSQP
jgi:hypothetical protein